MEMTLQNNSKVETKFNIGDEIYYMDFSEPKKAKIKGIAVVTGDFNDSNFSNINDSENKKATIKITDNSNCR